MWIDMDKRKPKDFEPVDVKVTYPDGSEQEVKNCTCEDGTDWLDMEADLYLDEMLPAHGVTHWKPRKKAHEKALNESAGA